MTSYEAVLEQLYKAKEYIDMFQFVYIPEDYIIELCDTCAQIFLGEPSILSLTAPITVCGDTHGQFTDSLRIFETIGKPGETKYVFLGDYVDRGAQSIENIVLLLTLKVLYPDTFFLTRGNHETEEISTVYGLRDEVFRRYGFKVYAKLLACFDCMPFAALINNTILGVHGGIPESGVKLSDIMSIERPIDIQDNGPITNMLWSDPGPDIKGFRESPRGVSFLFGADELKKFIELNNISLVIRSHEFCPEGVAFPFGKNGKIITVFSASNYCRTMNTSAVVTINENLLLHFTLFCPNSAEEEN